MANSRWFGRIAAAAIVTSVFSAGEVLGRAVVMFDPACLASGRVTPAGVDCDSEFCGGQCMRTLVGDVFRASPPQHIQTVACACDATLNGDAAANCSAKEIYVYDYWTGTNTVYIGCVGGCGSISLKCRANGATCSCQ
jgi:hypothetical protein